jgi:hypothetical protein
MSNTILTPTAVTREALRVLHQKLNFVGSIERQYDDQFAKDGAKIGSDLKIRLPNQYVVRTGAALVAQDTTESSTTLTVATQKGVDLNFTSTDLTLSLDDFSKRILEPAMSVLAANIEADAMNMYKDVYQSVWNGAAALTLAKVAAGRKILQDALTPSNDRTANLNTQDMVDLSTPPRRCSTPTPRSPSSTRKATSAASRASTSWKTPCGRRTPAAGPTPRPRWTPDHGHGRHGDPSLTMASGSGTFVVGDVFTIGNCFKVHPETKVSTGILQQFVVHRGQRRRRGEHRLQPLHRPGRRQAERDHPDHLGDGCAPAPRHRLDRVGTSLLYQKEAFAFATADLVMPKGVDFSARKSSTGSPCGSCASTTSTRTSSPCRLDVLYGYKTIRPQLAFRSHNN